LTLAGLTADDIALRLHCSLRLIRTIRAEPATILSAYVQAETRTFDSEMRLARSEQLRLEVELARTVGELERVRNRLLRATAPNNGNGAPLCSKGLHRMTPYNTYQHEGRLWCRECHRDRQADHRARRRQAVPV
jgi:hypothetical protein